MNKNLRLAVCFMLWSVLPAWAEFPGKEPLPGIQYEAETRTDPPMRLFVVKADLTNPKLAVHVAPGGPDPDGPGEWETTLMPPTAIAAREGFDLVVNGDFFTIRSAKTAASAPHDYRSMIPQYRNAVWAGAIGPAASEGKAWSAAREKRPCLVVRKDGKVTIEPVRKPPAAAQAVIAGNVMLVDDGKAVPQTNTARHPRTVVGLDKKGTTLIILTVDGRRPGVSIGMTYEELAKEMLRLGCWDAVNLDGGGSTVLAMRDPASRDYRILNTPSDGRERPVANVLGITVDNGKRSKTRK